MGLTMLWEVYRYFQKGWIERYWIEPEFNFTYPFFSWVTPWTGDGMYAHFWVMAGFAALVFLGLFYRVAAVGLSLTFTYTFLLEETRYLNHFYLVSLITFVMIFLPAHRALSLDALIFKRRRVATIPLWSLALARFMIAVPYFFGGVAKCGHDWFHGEPMRMWLARRTDIFPVVGEWFTEEPVVYFFTYSGVLIDLLAAPALLWSRTRPYALTVLMLFHFTNSRLFDIGIFPWCMLLATTIFFPADWPRRIGATLFAKPTATTWATLGSAGALGALGIWFRTEFAWVPFIAGATAGTILGWTLWTRWTAASGLARVRALFLPSELSSTVVDVPPPATLSGGQRVTLALIGVWVLVQVLVPLRHYAIPGNVHWTEEGHRFAWHMKLRTKRGDLMYRIVEPQSGDEINVDPSQELPRWQFRKLAARPYLIHQYALHLAEVHGLGDRYPVEVYAESFATLNGRAMQRLIAPDVNLAAQPLGEWKADWIVPLTVPLTVPLEKRR